MINRNTAWKEALKQSQKRVNGFIKSINWDIKKQIKNGRFHASQTVVRQFSKEEQEAINAKIEAAKKPFEDAYEAAIADYVKKLEKLTINIY